jgi:hypothetical protein
MFIGAEKGRLTKGKEENDERHGDVSMLVLALIIMIALMCMVLITQMK